MSDFLLIQIRDPDDEIRFHEIECFAAAAGVAQDAIRIHDLLNGLVTHDVLQNAACIFIGGSGRYSAAGEGEWLDQALQSLRTVHASGIPTFASCWGHQAMARAMGGTVVHAPEYAEVGSMEMRLTESGRADPVFAGLPDPFRAQVGHEDTVTELPPNTTLLASSDRCLTHAYRFTNAPVYCTQFHPELQRADLMKRLDAYPEYVESIAGVPMEQFKQKTVETPEASQLIRRFLEATSLT
ncbi:MAG: type 1 glutamine amidotransferase [Planctomycetaceae bacterium]